MFSYDADGTPTPTPQPTPTPMPTHHFLPTRTPTSTPFVSVLATPTFPATGVRAMPAEAVRNSAWMLNFAIIGALAIGFIVDKLRKVVYNRHARVDR